MPKPAYDPQPGDVVVIQWADINEETLHKPEDVKPDLRSTKEIFLGWRTAVLGKHTVEYLLCARGDESLVTGDQYGGCAYPKGCVLSITKYKSRSKKNGKS